MYIMEFGTAKGVKWRVLDDETLDEKMDFSYWQKTV